MFEELLKESTTDMIAFIFLAHYFDSFRPDANTDVMNERQVFSSNNVKYFKLWCYLFCLNSRRIKDLSGYGRAYFEKK